MATLQRAGRAVSRRLPLADPPQWGLARVQPDEVRAARVARGIVGWRRENCAQIDACVDAFVASYGDAQGRCPEPCGGFRARA